MTSYDRTVYWVNNNRIYRFHLYSNMKCFSSLYDDLAQLPRHLRQRNELHRSCSEAKAIDLYKSYPFDLRSEADLITDSEQEAISSLYLS